MLIGCIFDSRRDGPYENLVGEYGAEPALCIHITYIADTHHDAYR